MSESGFQRDKLFVREQGESQWKRSSVEVTDRTCDKQLNQLRLELVLEAAFMVLL